METINTQNQTDYRQQDEEWIARYEKLAKAKNDDKDNHDWLSSVALVTRAARIGALKAALLDPNVENKASIENWLVQVQTFMDRDASMLVPGLVEEVKLGDTSSNQKHQAPGQDLSSFSDDEDDIDVDSFFEEYPEYAKNDWDRLCQQAEEDDSSSDEEVLVVETLRPSKEAKRGVLEDPSSAVTNGVRTTQGQTLSSAASTRPSSSSHRGIQQAAVAPARNPYTTKRSMQQGPLPPRPSSSEANGQPMTPNPYPDSQPKQPSHRPLQESQYPMPHSNTSSQQPRTTNHQHQQASSEYGKNSTSNGHLSWQDHESQHNPFQTAREVAQAEESMGFNRPAASSGMDRNGAYQQQQQWNNHAAAGQASVPSNQHFAQSYQPHSSAPYYGALPPPQQDEEPVAPRGGPSIPNSLRRKFQPPKLNGGGGGNRNQPSSTKGGQIQKRRPTSASGRTKSNHQTSTNSSSSDKQDDDDELPEELQHLDKELVLKIQNEIMESGDSISFNDIAGLEDAKQTVQEVVCWPMKRPDLFTGLRRAPNGLLLYGPPGTGKTLIGKAIAYESGATFFSISSSSLTSKWIGEGEKLVRTLFAVAAYREPAVVFIDEIDSLLTQRKASENEASRRIKTEFLVQLDGTGTTGQGRVLVIGATNRPQELDEAARRRFTKRLYIQLPNEGDRHVLLQVMLKTNNHQLTESDLLRLAKDTDGFSGADLKALCTDAAMGPIRGLGEKALEVDIQDVPPISFKHFRRSLKGTRPSVAPADLIQYEEWDKVYGSKRAQEEDDDSDGNDSN